VDAVVTGVDRFMVAREYDDITLVAVRWMGT
jgi:hypothetical protein